MPIISLTDTNIPGFPHFRKKISYDPKKHKFTIELPPFMAAPLGYAFVSADTQVLVEKEFEKAVEAARQVHVDIKKVVCYEVKIAAPQGKPSYGYGSTDETSVSIRASVCNQHQSTVSGRITTSYETLDSSLPKCNFRENWSTQVTDYSPEIETFFHNMIQDIAVIKGTLLARGEFKDDNKYKLR